MCSRSIRRQISFNKLRQAQNSGPSSSDSRETTSMTLTTHQTFNSLTAKSMPENEEELELSDEDFDRDNMLQQGISSINISPRFHGRSSSSKFVSTVFEKNRETIERSSIYSGEASNSVLEKRPQFWLPFPVGCTIFSFSTMLTAYRSGSQNQITSSTYSLSPKRTCLTLW